MYNINYKNLKQSSIVWIVFFTIGLLFVGIALGVFAYHKVDSKKYDKTAKTYEVIPNSYVNDEGTIMFKPIYHYTVNGKNYECTSGVSSNLANIDQVQEIKYQSKNPSKCISPDEGFYILFPSIFLFIGAIFTIIGGIGLGSVRKKINIYKNLAMTGRLVKGLPYKMVDSELTVNGAKIKKIAVEYKMPDGNTVTLFSDPIMDHQTEDADRLVDLLIDDANPKNYYIDFEITSSFDSKNNKS